MRVLEDAALGILTGSGLGLPLSVFLVLAGIVFVAASRLTRHADAIADATGLGRVWIGTVLLAASTSLPELATDVNAAALGNINIGVGDLFGSTLANMLMLAAVDIVYARKRILQSVALDQTLVGALGMVLTGVAALSIASGGFGALGPIGFDTLAIVAIYLFGMHAVYRSIKVIPSPPEQLALGDNRRSILWTGIRGFALGAFGLLLIAPLLVIAAQAVAIESGQSETMVGTILVGFTTSFPEIAATVAALRMGAVDLAIGTVFGSNAFNMCVLFAMDLAYAGGPLLASVSVAHVSSAIAAMLVLALGMMAILSRAQRRIDAVRVESLLIVAVYASLFWLLLD